MFNDKVFASFDQLEKARSSVDALTKTALHVPPSCVTVGTNIVDHYGYADQRYLSRLFTAWIVLGAVIGVGCTLQFSHLAGLGSLIVASLAFGVLGAAGGQLVAGLFDVIFGGSLEDRPHIEDETVFTVGATVPYDAKSEVEKVMASHGAKSIFDVPMPAK